MIVRVAGVVVDAQFTSGNLPSIHNALTVKCDDLSELVVEVQEHVDPRTARGIAMGSTAGLRRGLTVLDTGAPVYVPVGRSTLGRMFNVLGPDWAAANFSVSMSLAVGLAIICLGVFILQMAANGLKFPLPAAICLLILFLYIVYAGPTGGGWLALPSCIYLFIKALPKKRRP